MNDMDKLDKIIRSLFKISFSLFITLIFLKLTHLINISWTILLFPPIIVIAMAGFCILLWDLLDIKDSMDENDKEDDKK